MGKEREKRCENQGEGREREEKRRIGIITRIDSRPIAYLSRSFCFLLLLKYIFDLLFTFRYKKVIFFSQYVVISPTTAIH